MSSKHFIAKDWLSFSNQTIDSVPPISKNQDQSDPNSSKSNTLTKFESINLKAKTKLAPFNNRSLARELSSELNNFIGRQITPGWTGDSLFSKAYRKILNFLHLIEKDAFNTIQKSKRFPKSYQQALYSEFKNFVQLNKFDLILPENHFLFWEKLIDIEGDLEGNEHKIYHDFFRLYSKKIALIYLLKVRLAFKITSEKNKTKISNEKIFLYPQSSINSIFPPGSSQEIKSLAFESNLYSWYRPNLNFGNSLNKLQKSIEALSYSDIFKLFNEFIRDDLSSQVIITPQESFSHAISHKNFGLFLNSLIINFPLWVSKISQNNIDQAQNELLSTLFCGDQLSSIAEAFFLAQENNKYIKWEQILYPDFKKEGTFNYNFYRICYELLSITFLNEVLPNQNIVDKNFIPKTLKEHYINKKFNGIEQKNLLSTDGSNKPSHYNRILLNIVNVPKNNSLHYIFNKISKTTEYMKEDGYLFVLSNRKILLSSQKNRIISLTKNLNLEACFNLENIIGKGEIPNFIYVFSKKDPFSLTQINQEHNNTNQLKENFYNFRLEGELNCLSELEVFTNLTQNFFLDHIFEAPPLFQNESNCNKSVEFYQDALIDGVVINANHTSSDHITHPSYFRTLMKSCQPLNYFFELRQIDFEEKKKEFDLANFLNESSINYSNSNTILVVDKRNDNLTEVEIIQSSTLEAKKEKYGVIRCHYFELIPKWPKFNQLLLQNYFHSSIGKQLINLTFSNENKKIKSTLEKLLIPKLFSLNDNNLFSANSLVSFFLSTENEISSLSSEQIQHLFNSGQRSIYELAGEYPKECLSTLSTFQQKLINIHFRMFNQSQISDKTLTNNFFINRFKHLPVKPIFPNNNDLFIQFSESANKENLNLPFTNFQINKINSTDSHCEIILYHKNYQLISLRTTYNFAQFLKIILEHVKQQPIKSVLLKLKIPCLNEFNKVVDEYLENVKTYENLIDECHKSFELILTKSISFR